jgi:cell division protein FtsL
METRREKFWSVVVVLIVAIATTTLFLWRRDAALIKTVRQETVELRAELEARGRAISELQVKLEENLQHTPTQPPADSLAELARRFDRLTVQQNKTLVLLQSLASRAALPEQREQQRQLAIASLETQVKAQEEMLDAAKQKVEQFVTTWNVPDEVSKMAVSDGLDSVALKQYWPYFEARQEREELQRFVSILKMKVMSEKIDSGVEATKDVSR